MDPNGEYAVTWIARPFPAGRSPAGAVRGHSPCIVGTYASYVCAYVGVSGVMMMVMMMMVLCVCVCVCLATSPGADPSSGGGGELERSRGIGGDAVVEC